MEIYNHTAYKATKEELDARWHRGTSEMCRNCAFTPSTCRFVIMLDGDPDNTRWCKAEEREIV